MNTAQWPKRTLAEVAEVSAGNPAPQGPDDFCADGRLFVRMQDVGRQHHTKTLSETVDRVASTTVIRDRLRLFPAGTLLIPKSGASVNLNHRALLGVDAYVVSHLATVVPDQRIIDPEYLYYWSLTYDPRHQAQTTSLPSLPTSLIKAAGVPVPPIVEQRQIVDLLSRAENIVRMRREAEAKAKEIIPALFLDMFGDPARNERGWERRPLGEIVRSIDSGKSPNCDDRAREPGEWGVLKLGSVTWGRYDESECKVLPSSIQPFIESEVRAGDLLLSRKNTFELVGASAYVWNTAGRMLLPDLIFRLCIADGDVVNPIFLWALLSTDAKRNQLRGMASGAAASMPNISKGRLATLPLELPPIGAQRTFADRVRQAHELEEQQARATVHSDQAFQSLLAGVFGEGR